LAKRFGANEILKDITFEVGDGEFCIFLGPSGCGKSTLLRLIAGLEEPNGGEIRLGGKRIDRLPPRDRDTAFVFQTYALYPHMSVFENLAFALRMRGVPPGEIDAKVRDAARLLEIEALLKRRPQALSGGQRQRVALGRAIVRQPKIFLFDEPLSNLDAALRTTMRVELARLHRRLKATIVYVTHDQAEALTLGEKIIVLHEGCIQQIGTAAEIYHRPANIQVARFVGSPQMNLLEGTLDEGGSQLQCGKLELNLLKIFGKPLTRLAGKSLTVGMRAEDLQVVSPDEGWIRGEVDIVEDLGSDRYLHLQCNRIELVVRTGRETALEQGLTVGLNIAPGKIHFFQGERRIEP
jgi:ABC-type sugar transport system ATPase subunit